MRCRVIPIWAGWSACSPTTRRLILEALKQAGKLNEIKVIGFDEADETLQGIEMARSMAPWCRTRLSMAANPSACWPDLARGQSLRNWEFPNDGFLNIEARQIRKDNVDEFWAELKKNLGEE